MMLRQWFGSLVNRAVALVVAAVLVTALVLTLANSFLSRGELEEQARAQVETIAELVASELDDRLRRRLETLSHVASNLTMSEEAFRGRARVVVQQQVALQHQFDGVYLIGAGGKVLAETPEKYHQTGLNVSDRDYFKIASSQLTPVISAPYLSNYQNVPALMIAAPIFDHKGRFIGMIGGAMALQSGRLIKDIERVRIGRTGYVRVITRDGVTVISSPGEEPLKTADPDNPVFRDAMSGFQGTRLGRNGDGKTSIMSVQQLAQVPWFVVAVWPEREAFAPITRIADSFVWILLAVVAVVVPLALWLFRRLMAPLKTLGRQIQESHLGDRNGPVDIAGGLEIRQVAETFNRVMDERDDVLSHLAEREAFFRSLTRSAPIGIVQTDVLGRIEFVNPAYENIMGRTQEELAGTYIMETVHPDTRAQILDGWRVALHHQSIYRTRLRLDTPTRLGEVWADVMSAVIGTPDKTLGTITVVQDITHELEVEDALRQEQQRAESILGVLQEGVLMVDVNGAIRYANLAACRFLGIEGDWSDHPFFQNITVETDDRVWSRDDFLASDELDSLYCTLRNGAGDVFDIDLTMLHLRQGLYNERMVFVLRDDSTRRREEERLSWEATHDSLTQLLNRRAFTASLVKNLGEAGRQDVPSVLMLIDLDHFKPVNDQGGHLVGDDLLRRLAELFKDAVRSSDTVARLGGDEFGIILPACGLTRAEALAEKIRTSVESLRIEQDGRSYGVTTSIGLTEVSPRDSGPREVMGRADEGTYAAKSRGRNAVVVVPLPPDEGDEDA